MVQNDIDRRNEKKRAGRGEIKAPMHFNQSKTNAQIMHNKAIVYFRNGPGKNNLINFKFSIHQKNVKQGEERTSQVISQASKGDKQAGRQAGRLWVELATMGTVINKKGTRGGTRRLLALIRGARQSRWS